MTPKEKAEELIYKFAQTIPASSYEAYENGVKMNFDLLNAKQCALIAVDEILFSNNTIFETNIPHECWKYWIEVKQEIEKL
jgi:hypothetical protein